MGPQAHGICTWGAVRRPTYAGGDIRQLRNVVSTLDRSNIPTSTLNEPRKNLSDNNMFRVSCSNIIYPYIPNKQACHVLSQFITQLERGVLHRSHLHHVTWLWSWHQMLRKLNWNWEKHGSKIRHPSAILVSPSETEKNGNCENAHFIWRLHGLIIEKLTLDKKDKWLIKCPAIVAK